MPVYDTWQRFFTWDPEESNSSVVKRGFSCGMSGHYSYECREKRAEPASRNWRTRANVMRAQVSARIVKGRAWEAKARDWGSTHNNGLCERRGQEREDGHENSLELGGIGYLTARECKAQSEEFLHGTSDD